MDNLFTLIVFLFIIYSILAPLLGKKKPQSPQRQSQSNNNYGGDVNNTQTSPQSSPTDILEDFLGFKIPRTEEEYQPTAKTETDNYNLQTVDYDTDLKIEYKDLEKESKMPDVDYDKLAFINSMPIEEDSLTTKVLTITQPFNERTLYIKRKLKEKNELRDVFLLSEIINKPKALRR